MSLQDIFTQGIAATRDVLVARASNDPTPNSRGANDRTAPAGWPATGFTGAVGSAAPLLLLAGVGVLIFLIARR